MSRISSLPSVTATHRADGKTFPTGSGSNLLGGLPGPLPHSLFRRAAQLFPRAVYPLNRSARGTVYDRLKIYKATRAPR